MQNYKKVFLAAAVTLAFSAGAMAETLKMGIEAAYPPFNNKDASGNVVGFDKEIGDALCAKMKVECTVVTSDWDGIIPALNAKKFDFLISSMSITDERKQAVDFTDPYYSNKLQFIAPKRRRLQDRQGLAERQSHRRPARDPGRYLAGRQHGDDIEVKLYDTQENAYLDLTSGRLDGILADKYVNYEWLKSDAGKSYEFKGDPVEESDKIGIAVRKGDPTAREAERRPERNRG